jgi:hypothetical protein
MLARMQAHPSTTAPPSQDCRVVEFRQYTLHPGQRDVLIELFDREFIETQEAVGMRVMGQFRDLGDPDRFVWLRGFADMASRPAGLQSFYGGPAWAAHRNVANATMIDSDNVLLLRPAWEGSAVASSPADRAAPGSTKSPRGVLHATVFHLAEPASARLLEFCRDRIVRALGDAGAKPLGWYVTEPAGNNFPRLPVREGENVLLGLALFDDEPALARFIASDLWQREIEPALAPWLARPSQSLRLGPTARSAIRA